jgi:integrase
MSNKQVRQSRFTDSYVRTLKLAGGEARIEVGDAMVRGLNLRVTRGNDGDLQRIWMVRYCPKAQKQRRVVIGQYRLANGEQRGMSLEAARSRALDISMAARLGRDLIEEEERARKAAEELAARVSDVPTLDPVLRRYVKEGLGKKNRAATHVKGTLRIYERHVFPALGTTPLTDLQPAMIHDLVQAVADKTGKAGGPVCANRVLTAIKAGLNWAIVPYNAHLKVNPAAEVEQPSDEVSTSRALEDRELPYIWKAAGLLVGRDEVCGATLRLMLLLGQRRQEVSEMRWSHLDLTPGAEKWTLPAWATKARRKHHLPLPAPAVEILKKHMDARKKGCDFVFIEPSGRALSQRWTVSMPRLREIVDGLRHQDGLAPLEYWTVEYARHTVRTGLGTLRIGPMIAELVLNHAIGGLAGIYDRGDHIDEIREALDQWARKLMSIVEPAKAPNVVQFAANA